MIEDRASDRANPWPLVFQPGHPASGYCAIALVIAASLIFAGSDVVTKMIIGKIPAFEIIWFRYLTYSVVCLPLMRVPPVVSLSSTRSRRLQWLRGFGALGSGVFFVASLNWIPITDATAISFTSPLFVAVLSGLILSERVVSSHWVATVCGFLGALLIVKPGSADFHPASILPVLGSLCWASALVLVRQMRETEPVRVTVAYTALIGFGTSSLIVPFVWMSPDPDVWPFLLGIGLATTSAHMMTVLAYGLAPAAVLAPFSYMQLIGAAVFGFIIFDIRLTAATGLGMVLIAGSGLYIAMTKKPDRLSTTNRIDP